MAPGDAAAAPNLDAADASDTAAAPTAQPHDVRETAAAPNSGDEGESEASPNADTPDTSDTAAPPNGDTPDGSDSAAPPNGDTANASETAAPPNADTADGSDSAGTPNADTAGGSALDAWLAWSVSAGLERPQPRPDSGEPSRRHDAPAEPGRPAALAGPVPLPRLGEARRPRRPGRRNGPALAPAPAGPSAAGDPELRGAAPTGTARDPGPRRDDPPAPPGADTATLGAGPSEPAGAGGEAPARSGRRAEPPRRAPRRGRRRAVGVTAAGVVGAGLAAAGLVATAGGERPVLDVAEPPPRAGACPTAPGPAADVDGDGCPDALAVEGNRVSAGDATWELGRPGDVVAVGDWDCDGSASSALLRPATGDVFVFSGWSAAGEPVTVTPTRSVPGGTGLRVDEVGGGCDALVVEVAGGHESVVAEARA